MADVEMGSTQQNNRNVDSSEGSTQNASLYGPEKPKRGNVANLTSMGKGRPKGVPNKINKKIGEMLTEALDRAGNEDYFYNLMVNGTASDRQAIIALIGRLMPTQIQQTLNGNVKFEIPWLSSRGIGKVQAEDRESLALVGKSRAQQDIQDAEIIEHDTGRLQGDSAAGAGSHD